MERIIQTSLTKINNNTNRIYLKRDDLLPFGFGGNKIRIAQEFVDDARAKQADCIIGYGNYRSNMCRALALTCEKQGIECHIISSKDDDGTYDETWNSLIIKQCHVKLYQCKKDDVSRTVEQVFNRLCYEGKKPYYIFGNKYGKGNEVVPMYAYEKVFKEIIVQENEYKIDFDYIFLPVGTGMTQAGLIAGKIESHHKAHIVGISIARTKENVIRELNRMLNAYFNTNDIYSDIDVTDDYLGNGYGTYDKDVIDIINQMLSRNGVILDPVYTGKAYSGMLKYLDEKHIKDKNILFIITGALPLFFDYGKKLLGDYNDYRE